MDSGKRQAGCCTHANRGDPSHLDKLPRTYGCSLAISISSGRESTYVPRGKIVRSSTPPLPPTRFSVFSGGTKSAPNRTVVFLSIQGILLPFGRRFRFDGGGGGGGYTDRNSSSGFDARSRTTTLPLFVADFAKVTILAGKGNRAPRTRFTSSTWRNATPRNNKRTDV